MSKYIAAVSLAAVLAAYIGFTYALVVGAL